MALTEGKGNSPAHVMSDRGDMGRRCFKWEK
jgi:hypothetical protein